MLTENSKSTGKIKREQNRFERVRWGLYTLLVVGFMLGFFERFAPGAFALDLMVEFHISGVALGTLSAMYFYTYTAMQIPAGALVDRMGARLCASMGALVAGAGSVIFSLAQTFAVASAGRFLVGLGAAAIFVALMKFNTHWFHERNFGMVTGMTILLGNLGAVLASGPLALLLQFLSWRHTFMTVGLSAIGLAILIYLCVRNRPQQAGFPPLKEIDEQQQKQEPSAQSLLKELRDVFTNRHIWPVLWANVGTNATFYAFAGLWGIPLLSDSFGLSTDHASLYTTIGFVAYSIASLLVGWWSDRVGLRKPFLLACALVSVIGWFGLAALPWSPGWSGFTLYLMVGLAGSQVVVAFAVVKEVVPPWVAGMAIALVNSGIFLAVALIQPLFGWVMDLNWDGSIVNGVREYVFSDYRYGLWFSFGISLLGLVACTRVRETYCRQHHSQ